MTNWSRRRFTGSLLGSLALPQTALAQGIDLAQATVAPLFGTTSEFHAALQTIAGRGNPDMAAGLILSLRFAQQRQAEIAQTLAFITGANHGTDWFKWKLWQETNPQITPHASFGPFMRQVYLQIDPAFDAFLKPQYLAPGTPKIRIEEIAWGGVRKDGIPSLDNPDLIPAAQASYLRDDDLVFGVSINGDSRAYPLRIMGWHEMFNDVIGGVPLALAYCTLCGSGILFETQLPGRAQPLIFGSSGFLYRSNKLMFDRETQSLWNQFTGQPVVGPLVNSGIKLQQRPVVITSWQKWKSAHPGTQVLSIKTGYKRDYGPGVVYNSYFGSPDLMFPAQVDQSRHKQKDYVFTIRQFGAARAWPLDAFKGRPVINDAIADTPLVLIGDPETRTVRAYERGKLRFSGTDTGLASDDGRDWLVHEDAITAADGTSLRRVAGHIAYWFAWDNYLGDVSSVYGQ